MDICMTVRIESVGEGGLRRNDYGALAQREEHPKGGAAEGRETRGAKESLKRVQGSAMGDARWGLGRG
jgi:hypothetical protein